MHSRALRADLLLLLTAAIWGAAFVAQRAGMDHVGPMTFNGIRFALGSLSLVPLIMRGKAAGTTLSGGKALLGGVLAGAVLFTGASLQQMGLVYTTAGNAGFITGLYVVIVPLLGLFFGQRPGLGCWAGALLAAVGLYFLSITEEFSISRGDFLVLVSAFCWSAHVLVIGWLAPRMDTLRLSAVQFAVCSLLSLVAAVATEEITLAGVTGAAIPILYGGLMSVGVAYTLQVVAQADAPPAHAAIILSLEGAFAAFAGWLLLDEVLTLRAGLGCALMLAGMFAAQLWPGAQPLPEAAAKAEDAA